jgi:hypothetical protein
MPFSQQFETIVSYAMLFFLMTGVAVIASRAMDAMGHHSIPWEDKERLTEKYGKWAVNRAESFCPENDVACVEREAKRLIEAYEARRGA